MRKPGVANRCDVRLGQQLRRIGTVTSPVGQKRTYGNKPAGARTPDKVTGKNSQHLKPAAVAYISLAAVKAPGGKEMGTTTVANLRDR